MRLLQDRLLLQAGQYSQALVGTTQRVLVTGTAKKHASQMSGRTECNRVVNFDGDATLSGQFVQVMITESLPNSLRGRWLAHTDIMASV